VRITGIYVIYCCNGIETACEATTVSTLSYSKCCNDIDGASQSKRRREENRMEPSARKMANEERLGRSLSNDGTVFEITIKFTELYVQS
jgi:hypothetical protein